MTGTGERRACEGNIVPVPGCEATEGEESHSELFEVD